MADDMQNENRQECEEQIDSGDNNEGNVAESPEVGESDVSIVIIGV